MFQRNVTQSVAGNMHAVFILYLVTISEAGRFVNRMQSVNVQAVDVGHSNRDFDNQEEFPEMQFQQNQEYRKNKESPREPLTFLSPRDEMRHYKNMNEGKYQNNYNQRRANSNDSQTPKPRIYHAGYDFSSLLERNFANSLANRRNKIFRPITKRTNLTVTTEKLDMVENYFETNRFYKKSNRNNKKLNWTTCDEFVRKSVFHPDDIVNTKWLPFYMWYEKRFVTAVVHTFSYPTKKKVEYFKTTYGRYYTNQVKWNAPKLLMDETREILLIAGDRRGLFHGIPDQELPLAIIGQNITLPIITIRMKIQDPYLVMMYCDEHYAAVMAELNTGPETDEDKIREASTIKFRGNGGPVQRDMVEEKRIADAEKQRKIDIESRKFLKIERDF